MQLQSRIYAISTATLLIAGLVIGCASHESRRGWSMAADKYVVAADHADASRAGAEILAMGGNAVDAAVAMSFALAVVRPESCGLGGGGFMLIHRPGESPIALDFREQAPANITLDHYRNAHGEFDVEKIQRGGLSVGIPGTVRGMMHALERYGSGRVSRADALAPAIRLARRPLKVNKHLRESIATHAEYLSSNKNAAARFGEIRRILLNDDGSSRKAIDRSDMAATLTMIAEYGDAEFYDGELADRMIAAAQADGGVLSRSDFRNYAVREWTPLQQDWRGHTIMAMPPPSSGGAVIIEALNILESHFGNQLSKVHAIDLADHALDAKDARFGDYTHYLIESMKCSFADRANWLGDASPAVAADVSRMTGRARATEFANRIDPSRATPSKTLGDKIIPADGGTCHVSIIDADGMAVASTESINLLFGSFILVPGTGIILNNTMDDFALDATTPNAFGLRQSERNLVRSGARPLSSMSPTIVTKDDRVRLVVGASGGSRIISSTLQVLLNTIVGGQAVKDAVAAPRVHHQWFPDVVRHQAQLPEKMRSELSRRGHELEVFRPIGHVQAAERIDSGQLRAACDPDKGGKPAGR